MFRPATHLVLLLCSMAAACDGASGASCTVDEDCPSRFCKADGTCGPSEVDAGSGDGAGDAPSALCTPNHDGTIALAELPLQAGKQATFRVALDPAFQTAGTPSGGGTRSWDLSGQLANDADQILAFGAPAGAWWLASFPTATYATRLSAEYELLGVFRVDAGALVLLGVVSPAGGTGRTELAYDPPATILALPLTDGATWASHSTVSGTAQGSPVAYTERYASSVDRTGTMTTPYGAFPVLRAATDLTRSSFGTPILTKRSFAWIAECFGTVATASSQDFESSAEFDDPAEVRRIAP